MAYDRATDAFDLELPFSFIFLPASPPPAKRRRKHWGTDVKLPNILRGKKTATKPTPSKAPAVKPSTVKPPAAKTVTAKTASTKPHTAKTPAAKPPAAKTLTASSLTEGQRAYETKRAAKAGMTLDKWLASKQRQQETEAKAKLKAVEAARPPKPPGLLSRLLERAHRPLGS